MSRNYPKLAKMKKNDKEKNDVNWPKTIWKKRSHTRNDRICQELGQKWPEMKMTWCKKMQNGLKLFKLIDLIQEMVGNARKLSRNCSKQPQK